MVTRLNATSISASAVARIRFRNPKSVAKYQPKRISRNSPIKNVKAGLIWWHRLPACEWGHFWGNEFEDVGYKDTDKMAVPRSSIRRDCSLRLARLYHICHRRF